MQPRTKYYIAEEMKHLATSLGLSPQSILRRSGLPEDYFDNEDPGLFAKQMFALWDSAEKEYAGEDLPILLGQSLAGENSGSIILAFRCSHTVAEGFDRIALFKPLAGPFQISPRQTADGFTVSVKSSIPTLPLPNLITTMDIVFFVELVRKTTGEHVIPIAATLPTKTPSTALIENYVGCPISTGNETTVTFEANVANLPLITENDALWAYYEKDLNRKLEAHSKNTPTSDRLRATLHKMLPSGNHTSDYACQRMGLSKRTLQRQLAAEGTTYQKVLDTTRSELSLHYLRKHDMSVEEVSYLLAFRDPNSFYRAFQNWTGMTPSQARKST